MARLFAEIATRFQTVGDVSATTKVGAWREATYEGITGATYADGLGAAIKGVFTALPNT